MRYLINEYGLFYDGSITANYKTKFKSATSNAISNASQTKAIKDTTSVLNGIVHEIHESMDGIFYSRSTDGGNTFSKEEVVNYNSNTLDANGNKNSYLNVLRRYQTLYPLTQTDQYNNVIATWERYNTNTQKTEICVSRRYRDPGFLTMSWFRYLDYQNKPVFISFDTPPDFNSNPKVFGIEEEFNYGETNQTIIYVLHLEPYNNNQKKLVVSTSAHHNGILRQNFELDHGNISDVSVTGLKGGNGCYTFYFAYVKDNKIIYRKEEFLYNIGLDFSIGSEEMDDTFTNNDGQLTRTSPDISLKNGKPIIAYRGNHTRNWNVSFGTGNNEDNWITVNLSPIIVYYKNSNNNDWTKIVYESDGQHVNEYPNVEGSKDADAYLLNFKAAPSLYKQFAKVLSVPHNNYHCDPPSYNASDAKLVRGCYTGLNGANSNPMLLTLNQNNLLYDIGKHQFVLTESVSNGNGTDGFDNMSGVIEKNDANYFFNLGPIFVRNIVCGFDPSEPPSSVESAVEFNSNMISNNFSLSNNDTIIIGAYGNYIATNTANFQEIKYHVCLMNSNTGEVFQELFRDTVKYEDSVETEYLRGYIISGIQNGTDNFYLQLFVDTTDAGDATCGVNGVYTVTGTGEGDNPVNYKKKVHFGKDNSIKPTNVIPKEYSLSQNYPNPFNPVTNIKYQLPKDGFVTLKIYDITGREIANLVKEYKQAGYYTVSFNGSNFASGVYFYRIQVGDFMQVKKMVLIK
jgi:hypothetical protein